jgi:hypothetical protein
LARSELIGARTGFNDSRDRNDCGKRGADRAANGLENNPFICPVTAAATQVRYLYVYAAILIAGDCTACGRRGDEVRKDLNWNSAPVAMMGYR